MTQQKDIASQGPGARQPGAGPAEPVSDQGQPGPAVAQPSQGTASMPAQVPAGQVAAGQVFAAGQNPAGDSVQPTATPEPVWPSPYLSEGAGVPEAYPAPPQPGRPRYGSPGGPIAPGSASSAGQPGYAPPGYGQQPGYQPGYGQPGYAQRQQLPRRPMGRLGLGGQAASRDPALAAAWERLLAMTLDWLLILAAAFLAVLSPMLKIWHQLDAVFANSEAANQTASQSAINHVLQSPATTSTLVRFWLIAFAIALAYFWALSAASGGTVGKHVLGLRVVAAADRSRISIGAAGVRAVAFLAGPAIFLLAPDVGLLGGLIWLADCSVMLLDSRMQCLHDRAAKTAVIRKRWLDQQAGPTQPSPW